MAYKVVDNEFNRANYSDMIGKIFKTPPSYANVIEVDDSIVPECDEVATKVIKFYAISEALTHGWDYLQPERRDESLDKLEKRLSDLAEHKQIGREIAEDVRQRLLDLEKLNEEQTKRGEGTGGYPASLLVPAAVQLAIDAIGNCVCGNQGSVPRKAKPDRYEVKVTVWEERDRIHIGIVDKATEQISYADWWDDDARQMFEDGFFQPGRGLDNSVLSYAEDMDILANWRK